MGLNEAASVIMSSQKDFDRHLWLWGDGIGTEAEQSQFRAPKTIGNR
jgi:hypothetical protein